MQTHLLVFALSVELPLGRFAVRYRPPLTPEPASTVSRIHITLVSPLRYPPVAYGSLKSPLVARRLFITTSIRTTNFAPIRCVVNARI